MWTKGEATAGQHDLLQSCRDSTVKGLEAPKTMMLMVFGS